jgi:hypothetical protein
MPANSFWYRAEASSIQDAVKLEIVHCPAGQNNSAKDASPVTLIQQRLNLEAVCTPGKTGQFDVIADGKRIVERGGNWFTRKFGAGHPEPEKVIGQLLAKNRTRTQG